MCLAFILFVVHCVTAYPTDYLLVYIPIEELSFLSAMNLQAIPVPYNNPALYTTYNPWYIPNKMEYPWSPYMRTTGPVTFGGQVRGRGTVSVAGRFGNDGFNHITSYSEPPTPISMTPSPTFSTHNALPAITKLPAVILPTTFNVPATNNMPSTLSVPETPMPFIMATATVPYSSESNSFESVLPLPNTVKFSGKVPASGRVRICKHFC